MSTIAQLIDRCSTRFKDTTNRVITPDEWQEYLADAYEDLLSATPDWPWLRFQENSGAVTLAAGEHTVDLSTLDPQPYRLTAVLNASNGIRLEALPESTGLHFDLFPDASVTGTPSYYRYTGPSLQVFPTPGETTVLHLEGLASPSIADAGVDFIPPFPAHYHSVLVFGALARAYEDDASAESAIHQARFDRTVERMRVDLLSPRTEGYPGIVDTF